MNRTSNPPTAGFDWPVAGVIAPLQALVNAGAVVSRGADDLEPFIVATIPHPRLARLKFLHRDSYPADYFEVYVDAAITTASAVDALTSLLGCTHDDLDWVQEYAEWPGVVPTAESIERELAHR